MQRGLTILGIVVVSYVVAAILTPPDPMSCIIAFALILTGSGELGEWSVS